MTLALYGKSRKRQGSLLLAALLAILAASVGALALVTSVFAHSISGSTNQATCASPGYSVNVVSDNNFGTDYWEVTIDTTGSPNLNTEPYTPYLVLGGVTLVDFSGTGAVNSTGTVNLYAGAFGSGVDVNGGITNSATVINNSSDWGSAYQVGRVIKWDNELMKITNVDNATANNPLTVTRAFGGTSAVAHTDPNSSNDVTVFTRTDNTADDSYSWTLSLNPDLCSKKIIVKKVTVNDPGSTSFSTDINNTDGSSGDQSNKSFSVASPYTDTITGGADSDDFTVSEDSPGTDWALTGKKVLAGDATCPAGDGSWDAAGAASGGILDNLALGTTVTVCFRNTYTPPPPDFSVTKTAKAGVTNTTDPAAVQWVITLTNNNGGFSFPEIFGITDNVTVVALVTTGSASCNFVVGNVLTPEKTCELPGGATATITVKPNTLPVRTCGDQTFSNQVSWRHRTDYYLSLGDWLSSTTTPASPVNIVLTGDLNLCDGSQTIQKSDGTKDGSVIKWTITVTNSYPVAKTIIVYDTGTNLVSETCTNVVTENPTDYYSCDVAANSSAQLVLSTPYSHADTCQPLDVTNVAYIAASTTAGSSGNKGSDSGTFHENASSAGCITWKKTGQFNPSVGDNHIDWYIDITNTAAVPGSITINDPGTTLVNESCSNAVSATSPYTCDVPANSGVQLIVRGPAITGQNLVCDNYVANNTAVNANNSQDSQTAQVTHYATPDKSCISVVKEKSDTSQPPTWTIKIKNTGDSSQGLYIQDADTTLQQVVSGGSCTPGDTIMGNGVLCTVNANDTLVLIVTKDYPAVATCEGTDVSNTVNVWVGAFPAPPTGEPDFKAVGGTFEDLNKDTELCNKLIQINKFFYNLNGYTPGAADRPTFKLSPNPFGAGDYTIDADNDGLDPHCTLSGTNPLVWTCTVPAAWVDAGTGGASETLPAGWDIAEQGVCGQSLLKDLSGLAREVLSIVVDVKISETFNFCNQPVGHIKVIKIDNTTAGNTERPADWDFRVLGSDSFQDDGSIALGGGNYIIDAPLANGYTASELNSRSADECPIDGPGGIHGYVTTNVEDGPLNITQPGQEITFTFKNDDCGAVLGTGNLNVYKVRDINGNGTMDGGDTNIVWHVTIYGPDFPGGQGFDVPVAGLHLFGLAEGVYTVVENTSGSYITVGVITNEDAFANSTSADVNLQDGNDDTITFYNRPLGTIRAHKIAFTSHNGGPNVIAPNDDDGWTIHLDSANCNIHLAQVTDQLGNVEFNGLPLCNDYVISEDTNNPSSPGFVPITPASFGGQTPEGQTLTFTNRLVTTDPPCTNCNNIPTPTPTSTPTTPPSTPTTPPATSTTAPTNTPTPVSTQLGEKTPGPGGPTPIAPSTGGGVLGGTTGGFNLVLILGGLLALTSGLSFVALGRKSRR